MRTRKRGPKAAVVELTRPRNRRSGSRVLARARSRSRRCERGGRRGWRQSYLRVHPRVALKDLEQSYLYHIVNDELYELNDEGRDFLLRCDGTKLGGELTDDDAFVRFCLKEGLLERLPCPGPIANRVADAPHPSLRYLELQLSRRCNLACRHCYLGEPRSEDIPLADALAIARQFGEMGGLRLMISGGEPLLYPHLREFIEMSGDLKLRRILLTNGTLVTGENAPWLGVEEIHCSAVNTGSGTVSGNSGGSSLRIDAIISAALSPGNG